MPALRHRYLLCAAWAVLAACRPEETQVGGLAPRGGGSETTLVGRVVDEEGRGVEGASIRIRHEEFSPLDPGGAVFGEEGPAAAGTDAEGRYRIEGVPTGPRYLIECRRGGGRAAAVYADAEDLDSVRVPDAVLRPTGAVRGRVRVPDSVWSGTPPMYAYIPGLLQRVVTDWESSAFLLENVPAGTYSLRVQPPYPGQLNRVAMLEVGGIRVAPGETTDVGELLLLPRSRKSDSVTAYERDYAVVAGFFPSTSLPEVEWFSGQLGNRIVLLNDPSGFVEVVSERVRELDALESILLRNFHYWLTDTNSGIREPGPARPLSPAISELPHLRQLWLHGMPAAGHPRWTGTFPALVSLNLAEAGLDTIPDWVLQRKRLAYLDLEGNHLESLPEAFSRFRELRIVNLKGNRLTGIPAFLMGMPSLQGVYLRFNRICAASPAEKAWIGRQDSLWLRHQDPLSQVKDSLAWEESQDCGGP